MSICLPLIEQRADPYVVYHEGSYYFTASVPEYDRIEIRKAQTIKALRDACPKIIWRKHTRGPMSWHIWAPELHCIDGKWYIYFAAGQAENIWEIRPYVLCCDGDPMTGTWRELGAMQAAEGDPYSFTDFSLDGTTFEAGGKRYFVWAEKVGRQHGISNLYIAEMASPVKLKTVQRLLSTPDYDWERIGFWVNEGAAVLRHADKIHIFYSASATGAMYCMGMLPAAADADLCDPAVWSKERVPVLTTQPKAQLFGPGHNSFTVNEKGEDICVFHARPYEHIEGDPLYDPNRHAFVARIRWDANGKPVFDIIP